MDEPITSNLRILYLQGPNIHALGQRQPEIYGAQTYLDLINQLDAFAQSKKFEAMHFQSDSESALIQRLYQKDFDGVVCNPAAFTHTSIALRDTFLTIQIPFIEVHISNIYRRDHFRQKSYFVDIAIGSIVGLGTKGYELATLSLLELLRSS